MSLEYMYSLTIFRVQFIFSKKCFRKIDKNQIFN